MVDSHGINPTTSAGNSGNNEVHGQDAGNPPNPPAPNHIALDAATTEGLRDMMFQMIQGLMPTAQTATTEVGIQNQAVDDEAESIPVVAPDLNANFARALKTFLSMKPDTYDGTGEPIQITFWFTNVEQLLDNITCSESEKVRIAALQLKGGASEWWKASELAKHPQLSWSMFKKKMLDRYFSAAMRKEKEKEFHYPQVEGLKIPEIANKFSHLLQYSGLNITTEEQKIERFFEWLSPEMQPLMVHVKCETLEQYVDAAYRLEVSLEASNKKSKTGGQSVSLKPMTSGFKRPAPPQHFDKSSKARSEPRSGQKSDEKRPLVCYNCGESGHTNRYCRKPLKKCFTCGKEGHVHSYCPQNRSPAQSQQSSVAQNSRAPPEVAKTSSNQSPAQNKGKTPVRS